MRYLYKGLSSRRRQEGLHREDVSIYDEDETPGKYKRAWKHQEVRVRNSI